MWSFKRTVVLLAVVERLAIFLWGLYQDATMVPRFTDIDYMVFTDASRFVSQGGSPYDRDTYRYTPLLSLLLLPTSIPKLFNFGKILFMFGDLVAGDLIIRTFEHQGFSPKQASVYSSLWLFNPMVSVISTRGSSEGLLGVFVMLILWCAETRRDFTSGLAAGLAVHFKIYPFIYVPTVLWNMGPPNFNPFTRSRIYFLCGLFFSFFGLTGAMYLIYGREYLDHSWIHHLIRLDHRHNFSVYSTVMYYASANSGERFAFEQWAFVPQLLLSGIVLPLAFARTDLAKTMAVQTITFVAFNKVCTSQYFIWYMVLLPFFLPALVKAHRIKWVLLTLWVAFQALWLYHGFQLEFLGTPTFYPELFNDTILFFAANIALICFLIHYIPDTTTTEAQKPPRRTLSTKF